MNPHSNEELHLKVSLCISKLGVKTKKKWDYYPQGVAYIMLKSPSLPLHENAYLKRNRTLCKTRVRYLYLCVGKWVAYSQCVQFLWHHCQTILLSCSVVLLLLWWVSKSSRRVEGWVGNAVRLILQAFIDCGIRFPSDCLPLFWYKNPVKMSHIFAMDSISIPSKRLFNLKRSEQFLNPTLSK